MTLPITGAQLPNWAPGTQLIAAAREASRRFETVWLIDQVMSRHAYTLMGAIAADPDTDCNIGTAVTVHLGRNPVEMAAAFATIAELLGPRRSVRVGIGAGGAPNTSLLHRRRSATRLRETIGIMRALWNGDTIHTDDFPRTSAAVGWLEDAHVALALPVEREPPIIMTATGHRMLELAGEVADGLLWASTFPQHSLGAFRAGRFAAVSGAEAVERGRARSSRSDFTRIYGINVSISEDRDTARAAARQLVGLIVGFQPDEELRLAGIDPDECAPVRAAFREGLGVAAAADRVPQGAADALVISGTPGECREGILELADHAAGAGFDEAYIGLPLGPDTLRAITLLNGLDLP